VEIESQAVYCPLEALSGLNGRAGGQEEAPQKRGDHEAGGDDSWPTRITSFRTCTL